MELMERFFENISDNSIENNNATVSNDKTLRCFHIRQQEKNLKHNRGNGKNPLKSFTIMIGSKKLRFCIVSKNDLKASNQSDSLLPILSSRYFCSRCGQTYANNANFQRHSAYCKTLSETRSREHFNNEQEKTFQCNLCQKEFSRSNNFKIHMKLHESGQSFFCSTCGKWFRNSNVLHQHSEECMEGSEGVENSSLKDKVLRYKCNYCSKMFHFRRDRAVHERSHTGEKPYTCGYCGRGFTQSQALTIHIRTHTGEKPYTCDYCNGTFRDGSALRKHEYIKHLNEIQLLSSNTHPTNLAQTHATKNDGISELLVSDQFDSLPITLQDEDGETFDIPDKLNQ